jgi:hypothetical protein
LREREVGERAGHLELGEGEGVRALGKAGPGAQLAIKVDLTRKLRGTGGRGTGTDGGGGVGCR